MQNATVTALVLNFADACRALVPMLEGVGVACGSEGGYRNWDRIAEPLFHTLVSEPCAYAAVGEGGLPRLRIAPYGVRSPAGDCNAYVAVDGAEPKRLLALETADRPFDRVRVAEGEREEGIPLNECRFIFVFEGEEGARQHVVEVDLDAGGSA